MSAKLVPSEAAGDTPLLLALLILYLPVGYVLYRMRYPRGFIVDDGAEERERLLRTPASRSARRVPDQAQGGPRSGDRLMGAPGDDREDLIEAVAGAFRGRDPQGNVLAHQAFHDLDEGGRQEAFALAEEGVEQLLFEVTRPQTPGDQKTEIVGYAANEEATAFDVLSVEEAEALGTVLKSAATRPAKP
jgi:hypothetical protein